MTIDNQMSRRKRCYPLQWQISIQKGKKRSSRNKDDFGNYVNLKPVLWMMSTNKKFDPRHEDNKIYSPHIHLHIVCHENALLRVSDEKKI